MADKTIAVTLYSKRSYDYAGLVSSNPVLAKKEFIVIRVTDTSGIVWCAYKMGDGTRKFGDLSWRKIKESQLLKLSNTNLFNKSEVVDGYYVTGTQGSVTVKKANARFSYFKLPVEKGKSYVVTSNDFAIVLVNSDDVILGLLGTKHEDQLNFTFTLSPNSAAVSAYVSFVPSKHPSDSYMIMEGKTLPTEYSMWESTDSVTATMNVRDFKEVE